MTFRQTTTACVATALIATLLAVPSASATVPAAVAGPEAVDDTATVMAGKSLVVDVLANDTVTAPAELALAPGGGLAAPEHGTVELGSVVVGGVTRPGVTYTATAGWVGADSFDYAVTDASGETVEASVAVTVTPLRTVTLTVSSAVVVLHATNMRGAVNVVEGVDPPVVALQYYASTGWSTYARVIASATGDWVYAWASRTPGGIRWRAVATWADGTTAESASTVTTVIASPDPVVSGGLPRSAVPYSYRSGCPVAPSSLRRLTINYYDYAGAVRRGSIILWSTAVPAVNYVHEEGVHEARFRVKAMVPVDYYYRGGTVSPTTSDLNCP